MWSRPYSDPPVVRSSATGPASGDPHRGSGAAGNTAHRLYKITSVT